MQRTYSWYIFKLRDNGTIERCEWSRFYGYTSEAEAEQDIIDQDMTYTDYIILKAVEMRP